MVTVIELGPDSDLLIYKRLSTCFVRIIRDHDNTVVHDISHEFIYASLFIFIK